MNGPTILDVYTSGATGTRRSVFNVGEKVQFNAIHTLDPSLPLETQYKISWILESYSILTAVDDASKFETISDIRQTLTWRSRYRFRTMYTFRWKNAIPIVPNTINFTGTREETVEYLYGDPIWAWVLGYWKLTVIVELIEAYTGLPFSVYSGWHYRIDA